MGVGVYEIILKRRSIRKYKQDPVALVDLKKIINAGRLAPQTANLQPIKYLIVNIPDLLEPFFGMTKWAGYLAPQGTPEAGQRPVAYIVILADLEIKKIDYDVDAGSAGENMILTATEMGLGSCWLGVIDREGIRKLLNIPERYFVHSVIALGYPDEAPVFEEEKGSIKYYKDSQGTLHVPKRKLADIVFLNNHFNS